MIQPMQLLAVTQRCFVEKQLFRVLCGSSKAICTPEEPGQRAPRLR